MCRIDENKWRGGRYSGVVKFFFSCHVQMLTSLTWILSLWIAEYIYFVCEYNENDDNDRGNGNGNDTVHQGDTHYGERWWRVRKWEKKRRRRWEVPSAKMRIRIFYLLQYCHEYKFMFEYNIKMYNSHLIFMLYARSRTATYIRDAPTQAKPKAEPKTWTSIYTYTVRNGSYCITNNKHSHYAVVSMNARGVNSEQEKKRIEHGHENGKAKTKGEREIERNAIAS